MKPNEALRTILELCGLSQSDLARKMKITQGTVNQWCTGHRGFGIGVAGRIAEATGYRIVPIDGENVEVVQAAHP